MVLYFNQHGNLSNDLVLSCTKFKQLFGYNKEPEKKVENLFQVADKFKRIGCDTMFVFGSFATKTEQPNDIDVCFDISNLDTAILEKKSSILDNYGCKRYYEYFQVHLPFFRIDEKDTRLMKFMKNDKYGNERGIIKVNLNDLISYDKK